MPRGKRREFTLGDRQYVLNQDPIDGRCDVDIPDDGKPYEIWINPRLRGKKEMNVRIHEPLHGIHPEADDDEIDTEADQLTEWLWAAGYRKRSRK